MDSLTEKKQRSGEVVSESDDECEISAMVVLKKRCDMKRVEELEECFILDFDPFEYAADLRSEKVAGATTIDEDVVVISEKGQVACRDYPHSRHLCLIFPFDNTLHESYCKLCYCYVCDTAAPCKYWKYPLPGHCHASDIVSDIVDWNLMRELTKKLAISNPN